MRFNTKVRYGIRAMLEISLADQERGVFQKDIAEHQEISFKYLDPIISSLKGAGLIINVSGKKSGYRLTRRPEEITMLDVFLAFEHGIRVNDCVNADFDCSRKKLCAVYGFWVGLNDLVIDYFKSCTLADLQNSQKALANAISSLADDDDTN